MPHADAHAVRGRKESGKPSGNKGGSGRLSALTPDLEDLFSERDYEDAMAAKPGGAEHSGESPTMEEILASLEDILGDEEEAPKAGKGLSEERRLERMADLSRFAPSPEEKPRPPAPPPSVAAKATPPVAAKATPPVAAKATPPVAASAKKQQGRAPAREETFDLAELSELGLGGEVMGAVELGSLGRPVEEEPLDLAQVGRAAEKPTDTFDLADLLGGGEGGGTLYPSDLHMEEGSTLDLAGMAVEEVAGDTFDLADLLGGGGEEEGGPLNLAGMESEEEPLDLAAFGMESEESPVDLAGMEASEEPLDLAAFGMESEESPVDLAGMEASEEPLDLAGLEAGEEESPLDLAGLEAGEEESPLDLAGLEAGEEESPLDLAGLEIGEEEPPMDLAGLETGEEEPPMDLAGLETGEEEPPMDLAGLEEESSLEEEPAPDLAEPAPLLADLFPPEEEIPADEETVLPEFSAREDVPSLPPPLADLSPSAQESPLDEEISLETLQVVFGDRIEAMGQEIAQEMLVTLLPALLERLVREELQRIKDG